MWWAAAEAEVRNMERAMQLLQRALPLVSGDVRLFALLNIGEYALLQNEYPAALAWAKDAFKLAMEHRHTGAEALAAAFAAAATGDETLKAVRLYSFARTHFPGNQWPPPQYGSAPFERLEQSIALLPSDERAAAEQEGRGWSADRAFAEVLDG